MAKARVSPRKKFKKVKPQNSKPEPKNAVNEQWAERGHHNPILTALKELEEWPMGFHDFQEITEGDPAAVWGETLLALAVTRTAYSRLQAIAGNLWSKEEREKPPLEKNYAQALLEDALEAAKSTIEKTQRFHDTFNSAEVRIGYGM